MKNNKNIISENEAELARMYTWNTKRQINEVLGTIVVGGILGAGALTALSAMRRAKKEKDWARNYVGSSARASRVGAPGTRSYQDLQDRATKIGVARAAHSTFGNLEGKMGNLIAGLAPRSPDNSVDRGAIRQRVKQKLTGFAGKFMKKDRDPTTGRTVYSPTFLSRTIQGVGNLAGNIAANYTRSVTSRLRDRLFSPGTPVERLLRGDAEPTSRLPTHADMRQRNREVNALLRGLKNPAGKVTRSPGRYRLP
jgi:hypothetical protein